MWRGATSRALSALSRPSTISGLHVVLSARHSSSKPAAASAARTSYTVSKVRGAWMGTMLTAAATVAACCHLLQPLVPAPPSACRPCGAGCSRVLGQCVGEERGQAHCTGPGVQHRRASGRLRRMLPPRSTAILFLGCKRAAPACLQILGLRAPAEGEAGPESGGEEVSPPPARRGPGSRRGRPPLYTFFASIKKQYPKHVTLVRVSVGQGGTGREVVPCSHHLALRGKRCMTRGSPLQRHAPATPLPPPPRSASSTRRSALTQFCWCSTRG
jgi:hypothetical protein